MNQSFVEILNILRRWAVTWSAIVALGTLAALAYVMAKPKMYESSAVIQIEQASVKDTGSSVGNAAALQTLQIIEQRVMARDNLISIIDEYDLFSDAQGMSMSEKVFQLRLAAQVVQIADPSMQWRQDLSPTALNVIVTWNDPELAADIANELVNNVLAQTEQRRRERAEESLAFYDGEERRVGEGIVMLEEQIADYKRQNSASLPGALEEQRQRLADVRSIELEIDSEIIGLRSGAQTSATSIQANRVRRLENQKELYHAEAEELSNAISRAPEVEQTLNTIQLQLQKLTDQYLAISAGRAEAEMGHMLEASQKGDKFQVLEKALVPERPLASKRKRNLALGMVVSAAIATGLVVMLESRSLVIWSGDQLVRKTGLIPVVSIPVIETTGARRMRFGKQFAMLIAIAAIFLVSAVFIVWYFGSANA
ncbi:Wzz/FepE/Etk N-terminal domain-containing protein [Shimia thalassica]|uniref:Wzz/FepE/Etk N-terminal domain-containing protein n=1 Tax=Shimia thalassica TaxID=1715693 RepID=UPI0026E2AE51|nr:Wzz/FepE/Etk N-terminal domain-containing protein [Shimia thalassica]MDO6479816.1 Wzz/FepE/Etk N-terminal domain-containing protein [Shimia thalassica]